MIPGAGVALAGLQFVTGGNAARMVATLLVGLAAGLFAGWQVQAWRFGANEADALRNQSRRFVQQLEQRDAAWLAYIQSEKDAEREDDETTADAGTIAGRPEYLEQCLDADGLRTLEAAIVGGGRRKP